MLNIINRTMEARREQKMVNKIGKAIATKVRSTFSIMDDVQELESRLTIVGNMNMLRVVMGNHKFNKMMDKFVNNWNKMSDVAYAAACEEIGSEMLTRHIKNLRSVRKDAKSISTIGVA